MQSNSDKQKNALIIGGQGFLGYSIAQTLLFENWTVRVFDIIDANKYKDPQVQVFTGNISDKEIHYKILQDIDTVFYFVSHSVPGMNHKSLEFEIKNSLQSLDAMLSSMTEMNVPNIVFPSSGGTIYGDLSEPMADEDHSLEPIGPYGQGKYLSEEIIKFYHRKYNLNYLILRLANVYGCSFPRKVQQGVIDIFIQNILAGQPITIWGNAEKVIRDYIFIDDVCSALISILHTKEISADIYNIGTGQEHTLFEVIDIIEEVTNSKPIVTKDANREFGIMRNVLDIQKISSKCSWHPQYSLYEGIKEAIHRKTNLG